MATAPRHDAKGAEPWDARVLARVRHLHLRARTLTAELLTGEHRSRRVGQAVEFADYQEYLPGMDLRGLDWRVWGRTDKLVVKRFETETELPCTIVLDLSGDLATAGTTEAGGLPDLERSKAGYAITLAATLAYYLHLHGEPVGLELIAGSDARFASLPPRGGRNHVQLLFLALASARPGGVAGLLPALGRVGARTRRRSWVGIITDGMEEPSTWLPALGAFARRSTDLRLFHVFDRREWKLAYDQPSMFYSPEGGEELAVDPVGAASAFAEVVREYVDEVRGGVIRFGGRWIPVPTDLPMEQVLRSAILDLPLELDLFGAELPARKLP
ncbi:MAG: DUF58 domain-containing protein [Myxococcales bacterium]|nr:DUF58 domain-containing protein [Myxococcales bacterium]